MNHTRVTRLFMAAALSAAFTAQAAEKPPVKVNGYVLDSACAFTKNLSRPISAECAISCAKAGSPLVILANNGYIYWPISDAMPAIGQNERLMKFAGQKVVVTGKVFVRAGSRAIVIEKIEAVGGKQGRLANRPCPYDWARSWPTGIGARYSQSAVAPVL